MTKRIRLPKRVFLLPAKRRLGSPVVFYMNNYRFGSRLCILHAGPRTAKPKRFRLTDYASLDSREVTRSFAIAFMLEAKRLRSC